VKAVAFSPDGKILATASGDQTVNLWQMPDRRVRATLRGHERLVTAVCFSPDGKLVVTGSAQDPEHGEFKIWATESGVEIATVKSHSRYIDSLAFSFDGKYVVSAGKDSVKVWDVASRVMKMTLGGQRSPVAASPRGQELATAGCDGSVTVWRDFLGAERYTIPSLCRHIEALAFSPDGHILALSSDSYHDAKRGSIILWDIENNVEFARLQGHRRVVFALGFSRDGKALASIGPVEGKDGTYEELQIWDVGNRQERQTLRAKGKGPLAHCLAFSPDGGSVVSGGYSARLWSLDWEER
jgi:WD40 repeat protein